MPIATWMLAATSIAAGAAWSRRTSAAAGRGLRPASRPSGTRSLDAAAAASVELVHDLETRCRDRDRRAARLRSRTASASASVSEVSRPRHEVRAGRAAPGVARAEGLAGYFRGLCRARWAPKATCQAMLAAEETGAPRRGRPSRPGGLLLPGHEPRPHDRHAVLEPIRTGRAQAHATTELSPPSRLSALRLQRAGDRRGPEDLEFRGHHFRRGQLAVPARRHHDRRASGSGSARRHAADRGHSRLRARPARVLGAPLAGIDGALARRPAAPSRLQRAQRADRAARSGGAAGRRRSPSARESCRPTLRLRLWGWRSSHPS